MKEQYIRRVKRALRLKNPEKAEVLRDLEEIFSSAEEHGEGAKQVMERLGSPKSFADNAAAQFGVDNRSKRRQSRMIAAIAVVIVLGCVMVLYAPVLFQRGNPIPYLLAAGKITEETPYALVTSDGGCAVYISQKGNCPALFAYVEDSRKVTFKEQAGSGYIFSNGADRLVVSSEIYLGKYTVWQVPCSTIAAD